MERETIRNQAVKMTKKPGRKVSAPVTPPSPEELLDSLASILIERIMEESKSGKLPIKL